MFFPQISRPNGKMEPLFPTYVFCHIDPTQSTWPAIRWAPGMSYFLSMDEQPTSVPDSMIDYMRSRVEAWNDQEIQPQFVPGEKVTVLQGPFAGVEAVFKAHLPAKRLCQVLLKVVSELESIVELPDYDVRVISRRPVPVVAPAV